MVCSSIWVVNSRILLDQSAEHQSQLKVWNSFGRSKRQAVSVDVSVGTKGLVGRETAGELV